MSTIETPVQVRITATAEDWHRYTQAKARAAAMEKEVKQIESALGIPDPNENASLGGVCAAGDAKVSARNVDGRGACLGKLSVFWFPGCQMPAGFRRRIS